MLFNGILRFSGIILGFVLTIAIISELDKESAGVYFSAYANIMFFSTIMRLGMDDALLKYSSLYSSDKQSKIVAHIVLIKFLVLTTSVYLSLLLAFLLSQDLLASLVGKNIILTIKRLLGLPIILAVVNFLCVFFQGLGYTKISVLGLSVINAIVSIILIYSFQVIGPEGMADIITFSSTLAALFCLFWYLKFFGFSFIRNNQFDVQVSNIELMHSFLPLWIVVISGQVFQWGAQIVGSQYLGPSELADIAVSVRFSQLAVMVLVVVNYLYGPVFRRLYSDGEIEEILILYKRIAICSSIFMLVLTLALFFILPLIIPALGSEYASFQHLFYVFWAGQCVNVAIGPIGYIYLMCNEERQLMRYSMLFSLITVFSLYLVAFDRESLWLAIIASACLAFYKLALMVNFRLIVFPKLIRNNI